MPNTNSSLPPLFKYCDPAAVDILRNCRIKVPTSFNDPFELNPIVRVSDPKTFATQKIQQIIADQSYFTANRSLYPQCRDFAAFQNYVRTNEGDMRAKISDGLQRASQEMQSEFLATAMNKFGILCFSANPIQHLMWSHYAISHTGFVIEFDTHADFVKHAMLVSYPDDDVKPEYDFTDGPSANKVEAVITRKSKHWVYEEEYRSLIPLKITKPDNTKTPPWNMLAFEPSMVTSVTFGCRSENPLRNEITKILSNRPWSHVLRHEIRLSDTEYKLIRSQIP